MNRYLPQILISLRRPTAGRECRGAVLAMLFAAACLLPEPALAATVEPIAPQAIRGVIRDIEPDGNVLWLASTNGVYRVDDGGRKIQRFDTKDGLPSDSVRTVSVFQGKTYAGTDRGLAVFDGARWTVMSRILNVHLDRFVYAEVNRTKNELYVCSVYVSGGLLKFDGKEWKFLGGEGYGLFNSIVSFGFAGDEAWLGTLSGVVYRMKGSGVDFFRNPETFPGRGVFSIRTGDQKVFAATEAGVAVFEDGAWRNIDLSAVAGRAEAYVVAVSDGMVFAGGPAGIVRIAGGRKSLIEDPDGRMKAGVHALAVADGSLYAGTTDGLVEVRGWR